MDDSAFIFKQHQQDAFHVAGDDAPVQIPSCEAHNWNKAVIY